MQLTLWTPAEDELLKTMKSSGATDKEIAEKLDKTEQAVRGRRRRIHSVTDNQMRLISESSFPKYDAPLVMDGDALVLPDVEIPFHNASFLNNCIELAHKWKINQCILAGDFLHFDSVKHWEPSWTSDQDGVHLNLSQELEIARKETKVLSQAFKKIDFVLGNHSSRLLRALNSPIFPSEILRLIEAGNRWRIAPYYFSKLVSSGETYQIEHPNSAAKVSPIKLASKYQCHILQAHSHKWSMDRDISGRFWAINMGCVVDEERLAYAAQRHNTGEAHITGAVIVREGFPYLLSENTPWDRYMRM